MVKAVKILLLAFGGWIWLFIGIRIVPNFLKTLGVNPGNENVNLFIFIFTMVGCLVILRVFMGVAFPNKFK